MQQLDVAGAQDWLRNLFSWREKRSGMIMPDERLPWSETGVMGLQHVLAMFGSTVLAPILMGFDTNVAIFFSGIGTLLFFLITGGKIPSYLGSSFGFIAPVVAITGGAIGAPDIPKALGGVVICGLVYTLIGTIVAFTGSDWIDQLMPPIVTGGVVAIIGLNLAGVAAGMASVDMGMALITIMAIIVIAILGRGMIGRLPILLGTFAGYIIALALGGTNADGRDILGWHVTGVDFDPVREAAWFGVPNFQTPSFDSTAIGLVAPVAIVLVAENTGHIKAVSEMTRRNLMPYLGRGFIGDGVATTLAGFGGGPGVTTYAENIGVMAVTRVFSTAIFIIASFVAIFLGFSPKFGALIASIPRGVLGGVSAVLFGLIAAAGIRIWIDNRVDFSKGLNLFLAAVTLIVGTGDFTLQIGNFVMNGIALGTFGSIILYQLFRFAPGATDDDPGATPASAGQPDISDLEADDGYYMDPDPEPASDRRTTRRVGHGDSGRTGPVRESSRQRPERRSERPAQRFVDQPMIDAYDEVDPYDMDDPQAVRRWTERGRRSGQTERPPTSSRLAREGEVPDMPPPPSIPQPPARRPQQRPATDQFDDDFGYVKHPISREDRRSSQRRANDDVDYDDFDGLDEEIHRGRDRR